MAWCLFCGGVGQRFPAIQEDSTLRASNADSRKLGISSLIAAVALLAVPAWAQQPRAPGRRSAAASRFRERQAAQRLTASDLAPHAPGQLLQLLEGIDSDYRPIPADVKNGLGDPMATLLFPFRIRRNSNLAFSRSNQ